MKRYGKIIAACVAYGVAVMVSQQLLTIVFPNTYLGSIPIGGANQTHITHTMERLIHTPLSLNINGTIISKKPQELGITIDMPQTAHEVFAPNSLPFLPKLYAFYSTLLFGRHVSPVISLSDSFPTTLAALVANQPSQQSIVQIDNVNKKLIPQIPEYRQKIDEATLLGDIAKNFGNTITTIPVILQEEKRPEIISIETLNEKLAVVFSLPVTVVLQQPQKADTSFVISPEELRSIVSIIPDDAFQTISYSALPDAIESILSRNTVVSPQQNTILSFTRNLYILLKHRFEGKDDHSMTFVIYDSPNTDGSLAQKYIEIDLSQQKMYLFSKGELTKTYPISSGLDFPTPPGRYAIMNKAPNAFSKIYNVFMPWWMGFYVHPVVGASLGIHELPYWLSADGKKHQRPSDFIGSPHTGGCVALDVGAAKQVYNFADIGTPVLIYN